MSQTAAAASGRPNARRRGLSAADIDGPGRIGLYANCSTVAPLRQGARPLHRVTVRRKNGTIIQQHAVHAAPKATRSRNALAAPSVSIQRW